MFKDINESLNIRKVLLFLCVLPFLMAAIGAYYVTHLEKVLYANTRSSTEELSEYSSKIVEQSLYNTSLLLEHIANNPILREGKATKAEKRQYLRSVMQSSDFGDILLTGTSCAGISINGLQIDMSQREYLKEVFTGESTTSPILKIPEYALPYIVHAVPVFDYNDTIIGTLSTLEDIANPKFFNGLALHYDDNTQIIFIDKNGTWVTEGKSYETSFLKELAKENTFEEKETIFQTLFALERKGQSVVFQGQRNFLATHAIGDTGWVVVSMMHGDIALNKVESTLVYSVAFILFVLLALAFCMTYLFRLGKGYERYKNFSLAVAKTDGIFYFYLDDKGFVYDANEFFYKKLKWDNPKEELHILDYSLSLSAEQLHMFLESGQPFALTMTSTQSDIFHMQCTLMPQVEQQNRFLILGTDVSSYKASREMEVIKTQHAELQQIINALPNSLMVHSVEGVRLANKAALEILGASDVDEIRAGILYGMDPQTFEQQVKMIHKVLTTGEAETSEFNFTNAEGESRIYQNVQSPVFDDDGKVKYAVNLCVDITETLRLQKRLEGEVQRLHEILDSSPSGFFYTNERIVRYCNPAIQDMMGLEVGKPVPLEKLGLVKEVESIREKVESGINIYDMPMVVKDIYGVERTLSVTSLGTTWYGKWHSMVWAHDVTAIHNVQKELMSAKDAAEAATRAKSNFLATMSHEIRTPMNAVLGFLHVFEKDNLNQTQLSYIEKITISAKGLLRIINDILDFSKIEANKMDLEYTAFNLVANMDAIYSIMSFTAQDKGLTFIRTIDENVPEIIMGDGERLNQVLLNLLSNAIKFTENGSVSLHIGVKEKIDATHFTLECSVSDTGIGLSEEQVKTLFQPFTQADTSTSRRFGGTGLGLVISQRIIELMGGKIQLESTLGQGSTFTCTIPVCIANEEEQKALAVSRVVSEEQVKEDDEAQKIASLKGKQILIAEDNLINQEIVAAMLDEYALSIDFADNGQEAVKAVQEKEYALIFMDLQMPIMNGLDATKEIRNLGERIAYLNEVPIIAMTANVMSEDRILCEQAGMNDHVGKPISPQVLRKTLLTWLASK